MGVERGVAQVQWIEDRKGGDVETILDILMVEGRMMSQQKGMLVWEESFWGRDGTNGDEQLREGVKNGE